MTASLSGMTLPSWASHLEHRLAPPPLLLVQAYVNTLDLDLRTDVLAHADEARAWLADAGLRDPGQPDLAADLELARAFRESLRAMIARNTGGPPLTEAELRPLEQVTSEAAPRLEVTADCQVELECSEDGSAPGRRAGRAAADHPRRAGRRQLGPDEAVREPGLPLGVLRPVAQPAGRVVRHGLVRQQAQEPQPSRPPRPGRLAGRRRRTDGMRCPRRQDPWCPPRPPAPGRDRRYPLSSSGGQDGRRDTPRHDRGCHKAVGTGVLCAPRSRANRQEPAMSESGRMDSATEGFVAHRNLLFTVAYEMLGSAADAEDRPAGDVVAVGGRRSRHGAGSACLPGPDHHPPGPEPAAYAPAAQGVLRRPLVARAAADRARRGRGCRIGRQRLDGDAAGAGDAHADRAGGVRAARGVRSRVCRDRRSRRQEPGRGPPDRAPGAGARRGAQAARSRFPAETRGALTAFQRAVETGDLQRLLDILAPDVVFLGDGGGVVQAALAPVVGAGPVASVLGRIGAAVSLQPARSMATRR